MSTSEKQRQQVIKRAGGRCECQVTVRGVWARCWDMPVEVHHMLPRSRGGVILDQAGEVYHLVALCHRHHKQAHSRTEGSNLMLEGYVVTTEGRPVYTGPDPFLSEMYA